MQCPPATALRPSFSGSCPRPCGREQASGIIIDRLGQGGGKLRLDQPTTTGRTRLTPDSIQPLFACDDCNFSPDSAGRVRRIFFSSSRSGQPKAFYAPLPPRVVALEDRKIYLSSEKLDTSASSLVRQAELERFPWFSRTGAALTHACCQPSRNELVPSWLKTSLADRLGQRSAN
jgi:hypothetical protein